MMLYWTGVVNDIHLWNNKFNHPQELPWANKILVIYFCPTLRQLFARKCKLFYFTYIFICLFSYLFIYLLNFVFGVCGVRGNCNNLPHSPQLVRLCACRGSELSIVHRCAHNGWRDINLLESFTYAINVYEWPL